MATAPQKTSSRQSGLHARNAHRTGYDFAALVATFPKLAPFVRPSPVGTDTIDFADPAAVLALNRALLRHHYGIMQWELPPGYLCPPIPGRADYLHHLADLLSHGSTSTIPRGPSVRILDIGVGANCVYPIIGVHGYGWDFVGSDIDPAAIKSAAEIVAGNAQLRGHVECRLQRSPGRIFSGIVQPAETFAACICNPPFHASWEEAAAGTARKVRNLHGHRAANKPVLNFGGQANELWCEGGESGFVRRMIHESAQRPQTCGWFTTLVAKRENLPAIHHALKAATPAEVRTIELAHGQKQSRILAWRF